MNGIFLKDGSFSNKIKVIKEEFVKHFKKIFN